MLSIHGLFENISKTTFAAILTVEVRCHKDSSTTFWNGTFTAETVDFAIFLNLVITEGRQLDLCSLMLDFLGGGVVLLLALLTATSQSEHQMKSGLLLDVVIAQGSSIFKLFAGEDQSLLVWRNAFLVLDFGFHILNCIRGFDLKGDGLAS